MTRGICLCLGFSVRFDARRLCTKWRLSTPPSAFRKEWLVEIWTGVAGWAWCRAALFSSQILVVQCSQLASVAPTSPPPTHQNAIRQRAEVTSTSANLERSESPQTWGCKCACDGLPDAIRRTVFALIGA